MHPSLILLEAVLRKLSNGEIVMTYEWAFSEVKHLLSSKPILKLPDLNKEFILQTDASNRSLGDVSSRNMMGKTPCVVCKSKATPTGTELFCW